MGNSLAVKNASRILIASSYFVVLPPRAIMLA